MSSARFWFVPLKDIAPASQQAQLAAKDEVNASDLPSSFAVPSKLYGEGIRAGDVLALHDGDDVTALARLLALDASHLRWRRLPMLEAPHRSATPELREIVASEAQQFKIGIDALLRDVPADRTADESSASLPSTFNTPTSNIILYGPPGTGKTYSVKERTLRLVYGDDEGRKIAATKQTDPAWGQLRKSGQVVFCTFHQAFAYEEFVEGLRASTKGGSVHYAVESGVFKKIANAAKEAWEKAKDAIVDDAAQFGRLWDLLVAELRNSGPVEWSNPLPGAQVYRFRVSDTGNIQWFQPDATTERWLAVSRDHVLGYWENRAAWGPEPGKMTKSTAVDLVGKRSGSGGNHNYIQTLAVYDALLRLDAANPPPKVRVPDQFVLIIDEINRANMARVFGELITLLEPDKRLGAEDELRVVLPASGETFGVPPNLHIIGTMNTADRSIALMDVALRRRFTFEEMTPNSGVIRTVLRNAKNDQGEPVTVAQDLIDLVVAVFEKINERLSFLYDREHQIGHAYFLKVRTLEDLRMVFATKVLPLLQEYFYGHWEKVALVLGYPLTREGAPKVYRNEDKATPSILLARKLDETKVLGFDHDEYENAVAWEIAPAFRSRWAETDPATRETYITKALQEVAGPKSTSQATDGVKAAEESGPT